MASKYKFELKQNKRNDDCQNKRNDDCQNE